MPLALPGQIILSGAEISPSELGGWEGRLAAVTLADGLSIFKRVGALRRGVGQGWRVFRVAPVEILGTPAGARLPLFSPARIVAPAAAGSW